MLNRIAQQWLIFCSAFILTLFFHFFLHLPITALLISWGIQLTGAASFFVGPTFQNGVMATPPKTLPLILTPLVIILFMFFFPGFSILADTFVFYILLNIFLKIFIRYHKFETSAKLSQLLKALALNSFLLFISLIITLATFYIPVTVYNYSVFKIKCGLPLHYFDDQAAVTQDYYKAEEFPLKLFCRLSHGFD